MIVKTMRIFAAGVMLVVSSCDQKSATDATVSQAQAVVAKRTTPAAPVPSRDWTQIIVATPEGGYRMGNPNAKVKFLEYASLNCPHCRDFNKESADEIRRMVAGGQISYEFRTFAIDWRDLPVSSLVHCMPPSAFFRTVDALYGSQQEWGAAYFKVDPDKMKAIQTLPPNQQLSKLGDIANLADFFKLRGVPRAKYESCLSDPNAVTKLQKMNELATTKYKLQGTPTFVLNDSTVPDLHTWPQVKAAIEAAVRA